MLGKSIGNLIKNYSIKNLIISIGSLLFFVSDLMLVLNGFLGVGNWASYTCIALYYPALSLLALSMNFESKTT